MYMLYTSPQECQQICSFRLIVPFPLSSFRLLHMLPLALSVLPFLFPFVSSLVYFFLHNSYFLCAPVAFLCAPVTFYALQLLVMRTTIEARRLLTPVRDESL